MKTRYFIWIWPWLQGQLNIVSVLVFIFLVLSLAIGIVSLFTNASASAPTWFTLGAVLTAFLIFLRNSERERQDFYLEKTISGYQNALEILTREINGKRTNRRVAWIAAARVLQDSDNLSKKIVSKLHIEAHYIYKNKYRLLIGGLLEFDNSGERLQPSFWYGGDSSLAIDEAAKQSTTKEAGGIPRLEYIPEKAIYLIWSFAQFPKNYEDPLDSAGEFTNKTIRFMEAALNPGLAQYLKHQDTYFSIDGALTLRNPPKKRKES